MNDLITQSRANDTKSLKWEALEYLLIDSPSPAAVLAPKPTKGSEISEAKSDRGFAHPMLGRLLCPARLLSTYDEDARYVIPIYMQ